VNNRIVLQQKIHLDEQIVIEGPPLEALRFQGARCGKIVTVADREGREFRGRVVELTARKGVLFFFDVFPSSTESSIDIILLQALPEKERMELIIQKVTELGVSAIFPFKSSRSISLEEREAKQRKAHRWQTIAVKAVEQSRRARIPQVGTYRTFEEALALCDEEGLKILLWEKGGEPLKNVIRRSPPKKIYALVGPEGGFTDEEVERATATGFVPVKLGQRILRTETAAITLIGILQYELGDLS